MGSSNGARALRRIFAGALIAAATVSIAPPMLATSAAHAQAADGDVAAFYRARGGAPLWFSPHSGAAAQQLIQLACERRRPITSTRKRYNVRALAARASPTRASGNPGRGRSAPKRC